MSTQIDLTLSIQSDSIAEQVGSELDSNESVCEFVDLLIGSHFDTRSINDSVVDLFISQLHEQLDRTKEEIING